MMRRLTMLSMVLVLGALAVQPAAALVEEKTGFEYPDAVDAACGGQEVSLQATGTGVREKTFMKVDVYTIVSYVQEGAELGDAAAAALMTLQQPKRLQMDLRRGFSQEKLCNAFTDVIAKNYEDQSAFAADTETFLAYFTRDAQENDVLVFDYCPAVGLTTTLNGEVMGIIENSAFTEALWSVWFGEKPANKGLREKLLSALP